MKINFNSKSEFTKNVLTLMIGTTIAQAIPIIISPLLTRIYTPEDFGVFALFFAISAILGSVSSARYELAIMIPKKDEDAINIFALGLVLTLTTSLIMLILIILFYDFFTSIFEENEMKIWLYFVPFSVFFIGFFNLLNYFNNRKKNYQDLRDATIIKSIVLAVVQLLVGVFKQGPLGLILGLISSNMFANLKLLKNIIKNKYYLNSISKVKIIALSKRYKKFPIYNLPSTLADTVTLHLPFLVIPKIFNLSVSGYFSLSQKMITLPSSLIAKSISQVYFQKMTENKNLNIQNMPLLLNTMKKLFYISLPFAVFIFLFSPYLFEIIFGKNWIISGEIAQYLSFIFFITFIVSTLSVTLIVYEKLKLLSIWQYLYLVSSICFFGIVFYLNLDLKEFLFYYVIHECIIYSIYLFIIIKTVKNMDNLIEE